MAEITLEELLQAIPSRSDDEGRTIGELCEVWQCSRERGRQYLRKAKEAGVLVSGTRRSTRIDGQRYLVPVYSFVIKKLKEKRK